MAAGSFAIVAMGCGGAAREAPASAQPVTQAQENDVAAQTVDSPRLVVGAVSWQLLQPLRVDESGTVFQDGRRFGNVTADGNLTDTHGAVAGRVDADGWIVVGDARSQLRILGDTLVEVGGDAPESQLVMRIDGGELVTGGDDEEERFELVGFRPELAREVLFVSGVMYALMAQSFGRA